MTTRSSVVLLVILIALNATAFHDFLRDSIRSSYRQRDLVMKVEYRNAKITDISSISELCSASFDGPFQWHQQIQRLQSVENFKLQLTDRLNNLVSKGIKHCMIVAVDTEKPAKSSVVGFLEIGLLPSPTLANESSANSEETPNDAIIIDGSEYGKDLAFQATIPSETIENREAEGFIDDSNSSEAIIGEGVITDETQLTTIQPTDQNAEDIAVGAAVDEMDGSVDPNELVLAAAAVEADRKAKLKREEVPYLGNVAVSEDCRLASSDID